ncbi:MAG: tetratricopeptide repeat protein [Gemmataceae bacterium]|nr:tetratricopeptide repeat protein [Gemmataceae bacterium]
MAGPAERTFRLGRVVLAAAVACGAVGCQSMHSLRANFHPGKFLHGAYDDPHAEERLAQAEQLYAGGQYAKAHDAFKEIADNTSNAAVMAERARFMQAECRFARGHLPEAVDVYHKLLIDFPTGAHRRPACARMFEISDYWLNDFRDELKRREGEKGVLRWHPRWPNPFDRTRPTFDQEGRATEALERVQTQDPIGPTADKALFWCGFVNYVRGNFNEADHFFSQLVELHKDSPLRPQAIAFAIQAKNNATGGAVYDGRKCAEALHLVHVAEATVPELASDPAMVDKLNRAKFAIQYQQAEKDFRTAEYYERTGHPGSAVFYYELVRRRYAGTNYADAAAQRKDGLMAAMKAGRPLPGNDPLLILRAKWKEMFGAPSGVTTADDKGTPVPQQGSPVVPAAGGLPVGGGFGGPGR